jgi:hypothetical protein
LDIDANDESATDPMRQPDALSLRRFLRWVLGERTSVVAGLQIEIEGVPIRSSGDRFVIALPFRATSTCEDCVEEAGLEDVPEATGFSGA